MRSAYRDEDRAATRRMIDDVRDLIPERGFHLALWGALLSTLFGLLAAEKFEFLFIGQIMREGLFVALMIGAVLGSFLFERYHADRPANAIALLLLKIWACVAIGLLVTGFLGGVTVLAKPGPHVGSMAAVIAIGFTLSSDIVGGRIIRILAVMWWAFAVLFFFLNDTAALFLAASVFFGALFLPGCSLFVSHYMQSRQLRQLH